MAQSRPPVFVFHLIRLQLTSRKKGSVLYMRTAMSVCAHRPREEFTGKAMPGVRFAINQKKSGHGVKAQFDIRGAIGNLTSFDLHDLDVDATRPVVQSPRPDQRSYALGWSAKAARPTPGRSPISP
jgi:hypothetical protein